MDLVAVHAGLEVVLCFREVQIVVEAHRWNPKATISPGAIHGTGAIEALRVAACVASDRQDPGAVMVWRPGPVDDAPELISGSGIASDLGEFHLRGFLEGPSGESEMATHRFVVEGKLVAPEQKESARRHPHVDGLPRSEALPGGERQLATLGVHQVEKTEAAAFEEVQVLLDYTLLDVVVVEVLKRHVRTLPASGEWQPYHGLCPARRREAQRRPRGRGQGQEEAGNVSIETLNGVARW
mmetsp:Transcript_43329/g.126177  ORF Transcript_43329/g.126177 Transcript_43329/m.126177 type:complete len:240 (-) Transcript_43329:524-1243(-)